MLKTRITEHYGLKVPFINAGMAFIATVPLARAVCNAGGMGMLGVPACPPTCSKRRSAISKQEIPRASGSISLHGSAGSSTSRCALRKRCRLWCSFGMMRRTSGYRVCGRSALTSGFKLAAWTKRRPLSDAGPKGSSSKAARLAATTAPPRQHSHCSPQSSMQYLPCPSSLRVALPMVGPLLPRWHCADAVWVGTRLLASFEAFAHPHYKDRVVAAGVEDTARHLIFGPEFPDVLTRGLRNRIVREWERRDDPPPYKVAWESELPVIGQTAVNP